MAMVNLLYLGITIFAISIGTVAAKDDEKGEDIVCFPNEAEAGIR